MKNMRNTNKLPRFSATCLALGAVLSAYVPVALAQPLDATSAPPVGTPPAAGAPTQAVPPPPQPAAPAVVEPTAEEKAAAKKALAAADKALAKENYQLAFDEYTKAQAAVPNVHAQYGVAMALAGLDKKPAAYDALTALLATEGHDRLGEEKLTSARNRLEELQKVPGQLLLSTLPADAQLTIDGQPHEGAAPYQLELLPGDHAIAVSAEGYEPQTIQVSIRPTASIEQSIALAKTPEPQPVAAAPVAQPEPEPAPPPPPPPPPRSKVPAYVTLGIAGAGAVVGTIFGIRALSAKSDFDSNPTTSNADDVERNALIADMALGVTITLGITGVVLLTTGDEPSEVSAAASTPKRRDRARLQVAPYAGATGGGAAARLTF